MRRTHHPLTHQRVLRLRHAPRVRGALVVVAEQVEEAVGEVAVQLGADPAALLLRRAPGGVEGDDDVAEERAGTAGRERQHVGRAVLAAPGAIEAPHGGVSHHEQRQLGTVTPERGQVPVRALAQPAYRGRAAGVLAPGVNDHGPRRSAGTSCNGAPSGGPAGGFASWSP